MSLKEPDFYTTRSVHKQEKVSENAVVNVFIVDQHWANYVTT